MAVRKANVLSVELDEQLDVAGFRHVATSVRARLGARAIGDDVHIRHNTTFGVLNRYELSGKPIIGNRVDIGVGACILGAVTVGDDSVIGPNSVVLRHLPSGSVVMGVPARKTTLNPERAPAPGDEVQLR